MGQPLRTQKSHAWLELAPVGARHAIFRFLGKFTLEDVRTLDPKTVAVAQQLSCVTNRAAAHADEAVAKRADQQLPVVGVHVQTLEVMLMPANFTRHWRGSEAMTVSPIGMSYTRHPVEFVAHLHDPILVQHPDHVHTLESLNFRE